MGRSASDHDRAHGGTRARLPRVALLALLLASGFAEARYDGGADARGVVVEVRFTGSGFALATGDAPMTSLADAPPHVEAGIAAGRCTNLIALDVDEGLTVAQLAYVLLDFPERYYYLARAAPSDPGERYAAAQALIAGTYAAVIQETTERYGVPVDDRLHEFPGLYGEYIRLETRRRLALGVLDHANGLGPGR